MNTFELHPHCEPLTLTEAIDAGVQHYVDGRWEFDTNRCRHGNTVELRAGFDYSNTLREGRSDERTKA